MEIERREVITYFLDYLGLGFIPIRLGLCTSPEPCLGQSPRTILLYCT